MFKTDVDYRNYFFFRKIQYARIIRDIHGLCKLKIFPHTRLFGIHDYSGLKSTSPPFALQPFPLLWLWVTNGDGGAMVILFCTNDMHRKTLGTTIPLLSKVHYLVRLDSYLSFD